MWASQFVFAFARLERLPDEGFRSAAPSAGDLRAFIRLQENPRIFFLETLQR